MTEFDCFNHELIKWLLRDAEANRGGIASTVLTGMLLLDHPLGELRSEIRSAIDKGGRILDEGLMFSIAKRAGRPMALRLLYTAAALDAPSPLFAKLFESLAPEIEDLSSEERLIVATGLVGRTNGWRAEADFYARQIRAMLFDSNLEVAGAIIPTISKLSHVTSEDIARLLALTGRANTRLSAVSSLADVMEQGTFPAEDLDQRFWRRIARLAASDDEWIRSGAARILAKQYRNGQRTRGTRRMSKRGSRAAGAPRGTTSTSAKTTRARCIPRR
jgi:hypothetical protein